MAESRCSVVETFLENIDLELLRYSQRFESQGYKTAFDLCLLEEEDLDSISITDPEDREKILNAGKLVLFPLLNFNCTCMSELILTKYNISIIIILAIACTF